MSIVGHPVADVDTPSLLVDLDRLDANIRRYADEAARVGTRLRPHIKTHKTLQIAEKQLKAGAGGSTTAKLGEAEVFVEAGVSDIFVAYPVIGREKALRAARLAQRCHLIVGVESEQGIKQLSEAAEELGATLFVRVEIDSGLKRTGVVPDAAAALCRQVLAASGLQLDGIFTFRGMSFNAAPSKDTQVVGEQEGKLMVTLAERLRAANIPIKEVSVGSTPTAFSAGSVPGITEVRAGTYVFFDRKTTQMGINSEQEIALSILATVVSRPAPDRAIVDAGSKVFCGDVIPAHVGLQGYGATTDGGRGIVAAMNEEHGIVHLAAGFAPEIG